MIAVIAGTPVSPAQAPAFSGTVSLEAGLVTFGQVIPQGQIPSGSYVKVGALTTQNDIKTTWSDGSARFVILTCEPGSTTDYTLSRDNSAQGSAMTPPTLFSNTYIDLDIGGAGTTIYRATVPTTHTADKWLNGALCVESRFEVTPVLTSDGTTEHGWLRVIIDVRSYATGEHRYDFTVENVLENASATSVTYDVDIVINNSSVYTLAGIVHTWGGRWRKYFASGYTEGKGNPDVSLMESANAIPKYFDSGRNPSYSISGTDFDPMGHGGLTVPMNSVGGRPEIAPYPDWAAEYLVNQSSSQREYLLKHGDLAGTFTGHIRNVGGANPSYTGVGDLELAYRPGNADYWYDNRASGNNKPLNNLVGAGEYFENAHVPSLAYIPYLVTGDRYYNDEMAYMAISVIILTWPYGVAGHTGDECLLSGEQVRGMAWGLRNIVDASIYCTDSAIKTHLSTVVADNLVHFDALEAANTNPLNVLFTSTYSGIRPQESFSTFMNNYLAWSLNHAYKQGYTSGDGMTMRNALVQTDIDIWNLSDAVWPSTFLAPAYIDIREYPPTGAYYSDWADVFVQTFGDVPSGSPSPSSIPLNGYYGIDHMIAGLIAIQEGMTDATAFYNYMYAAVHDGYDPGDNTTADYYYKLGWAIREL